MRIAAEFCSNLHPKIALFIPAIFLDKNPFSSIFHAFRINYFVSRWLVQVELNCYWKLIREFREEK